MTLHHKEPKLSFDLSTVAQLCHKYHIRKLALYGSVMRDDFDAGSDVDMLIDFEPEAHLGFEVVGMLDEFSELFGGHKIDFMTFGQLKPGSRLAHFIYQDLKVVYEHQAA
jgi:predicted nucleotidyltransferase